KLVEEAADVLSELRFPVGKERVTARPPAAREPPELDKEYEMLLDALGFEPATIDVLVARTHLPGESVASMLLILELEGRVAALRGGGNGRTLGDDDGQRSRHPDLRLRPLHAGRGPDGAAPRAPGARSRARGLRARQGRACARLAHRARLWTGARVAG